MRSSPESMSARESRAAVWGLLAAVAVILLACQRDVPPPLQPMNIEIEVGRPFPAIVLPSLKDGSPSSISQFRGQKLILHIFASW